MQGPYDHEQLIDYIEGELGPEAMARVDATLATDPKLRRLVEAMKADRKALRSMPADEVPYPIVDDVMGGLERQMLLGDAAEADQDDPIAVEAQRRRMRIGPRLLRIASYSGIAAALLVAGGVVVMTLSSSDLINEADPNLWGPDGRTLAQADTRDTPPAGSRLMLEDLDRPTDAAKALGSAGDATTVAGAVTETAAELSTMAKGGSDDAGDAVRSKSAGSLADAAAVADHVGKGGLDAGADRSGFQETHVVNAARSWGNRGQFALSVPRPDEANLAIEVVSDDPRETTAALNAWLDVNGAQLVDADTALPELDKAKQREVVAMAGTASKAGPMVGAVMNESVYCVVLDEEQVPELMAYMNNNRVGRQRAVLVEKQTPKRVALADVDAAVRTRDAAVATRRAPAVDEQARFEADAEPAELVEATAPAKDGDDAKLPGDAGAPVARASKASAPAAADPESVPSEPMAQRGAIGRVDAEAVDTEAADTVVAEAEEQVGGAMQAKVAEPAEPVVPAAAEPEPAELKQERLVDAATQAPPTEDVAGQSLALVDAAREATAPGQGLVLADARAIDELNTFNWGAVLGNQLPLAENTPLVFADRGRVVLPLVIREATGLDAASLRMEVPIDEPGNPTPNAPAEIIQQHGH